MNRFAKKIGIDLVRLLVLAVVVFSLPTRLFAVLSVEPTESLGIFTKPIRNQNEQAQPAAEDLTLGLPPEIAIRSEKNLANESEELRRYGFDRSIDRSAELAAGGADWANRNASKDANILAGTERRTAKSGLGELVGGIPRWFIVVAVIAGAGILAFKYSGGRCRVKGRENRMSVFTKNRIGRLVYLGWMLPICVISGFLTTYVREELYGDEASTALLWIGIISAAFAAFPIVKRLHDLNKSGWLWLLGLIPLVNLIFGIYLLFGKGTADSNDYGNPPTKLLRKIRIGPPSIISRSDNDAFYQQAYEELENRQMDKALWAKIFSQCGGNENKAKAQYITVRVERLAAEKPVPDTQPVTMSLYDQMKRNIENVEKAKHCGWFSAMDVSSETQFIFTNGVPDNEVAQNLLLNLKIKNLRELDMAGRCINVGDMKTRALYPSFISRSDDDECLSDDSGEMSPKDAAFLKFQEEEKDFTFKEPSKEYGCSTVIWGFIWATLIAIIVGSIVSRWSQ